MSKLKWIAKNKPNQQTVDHLSTQLNVGESLAKLLISRGIETYEQARSFFRPQYTDLHDPFLMRDMDKAIARIEKAFANNEKIMVYGDYDVDGTTSVAVTYSFFKKFHQAIEYYIPDRYKEGYGISVQGIDYAAENGIGLIIALDCGIKSVDKVNYANSKGIDFIICDHHLPGDEIPNATAVLDPKRPDCEYPYKELSGCGVGFKLCQAYTDKNDIDYGELNEYIDLVAVSIAADLVKITGENRVLAHYGLLKIAENPHPGLKALLEFYKEKKEYTISDLVFSVGPRINAAGRVAHASAAVQVLTASTVEEARELAQVLNQQNTERKEFDQNTTDEALAMMEDDCTNQTRYSTVLFNPNWHKGVIGIVASRLIERYYKPTIILTESEGKITGSARSVNGFDIHSAIDACGHLLEHYGGHFYAAGLTLLPENLAAFQSEFENIVSTNITEKSLHPSIDYDIEIDLIDITSKFCRILKQFGPFGPGNMSPVFLSKDLKLRDGLCKVVGKNHLKFTVTDADEIISFDAIAFDFGDYCEKIRSHESFDLIYSIEENTFNGRTNMQFKVKDIKVNVLEQVANEN
jgi:single-stranded-DNA-specific exonuclease